MVSTHRNIKVRALLVKIRTMKMRTWELLAWNHNIGQHGINCSKGWLERKLGSLENALWSLRKDLEGRAGAWESETIEIMTSWVCFVSMGSRERENWVDRFGDRLWKGLNILSRKYSGTFFTCYHPATSLLDGPWKISTPRFSVHPYYVPDLKRNDYVVATLSMYLILFICMSKLKHTVFPNDTLKIMSLTSNFQRFSSCLNLLSPKALHF